MKYERLPYRRSTSAMPVKSAIRTTWAVMRGHEKTEDNRNKFRPEDVPPMQIDIDHRLLALMALFASPLLQADPCQNLPQPSVVVTRLDTSVTLVTSRSYRSITGMSAAKHRASGLVLGLTHGVARIEFSVQSLSRFDSSGRWECVSPQIQVTYGYSPLTVYVANEYPEGTCAYNEIYEHEMRHVETYQNHLLAIEYDIVESLNRRFATAVPVTATPGETRRLIEEELKERWMPYIKQEMDRVDEQQRLVDTPEEYQRLSETCLGEVRKGIK